MERLKMIRQKLKKTQQSVADCIGVARVTYLKYESGEREPDFETLKRIAECFGTSASYLIAETNDPSPPKDKNESSVETEDVRLEDIDFAFLGEFWELQDGDKQALLDMARFLKKKNDEQNGGV